MGKTITARLAVHARIAMVVAVASFAIGVTFTQPSLAAGQLIRSPQQSTVYYLDDAGIRHAFPNALTYESWYGASYAVVALESAEQLATHPLGKNITLRPGKWLAKIPSAPTVYAVESGGVLRALATAEVAAAIYGPRWPSRVVDLPEVFFENYTVGEPLTRTYELPNSVVYQTKGKPAYYWKQDVLLQPFASWADVAANGYRRDDVVVSERMLPTRARPIAGVSARITDPLAPKQQSTQDCGDASVRVALALITRGEHNPDDLAAIQQVRSRLPEAYRWATRELGDLVADEPAVFADDGYLSRATEQGGRKLTEEVLLTFYDAHPDVYDFLIVFTNFTIQQDVPNHEARHVLVTNAITGLGLPKQDAAALFGSQGKLKGVVIAGDLSRFDLTQPTGQLQLDNLLLHEIAHQWSGAVKFRVGPEQDSVALLREDGRHWSYYAGFISPLGGSGWRDNGDGTFTSRLSLEPDLIRRPYSDLDLYLMGLLPAQTIPPFFYVESTVPGALGNTIKGVAKTVTIEQVIAASGKRRCELGR